MPTYTPRLELPRPTLDEPADGPDGFNDLTDVLDPNVAVYATGTTAARPPVGVPGRFYWNTDTGTLEYDDGTKWNTGTGASAAAADLPVLDVGMAGQIRAGRQLTVADFTALGLTQPIGLWNLSDLSNLGSDARALANKGTVPFGVGINGAPSTAAVFAGSASQALYIADSGAADPLRIRTGSWGCWSRTAKRGTYQYLLAKGGAGATYGWGVFLDTANVARARISSDGSASWDVIGVSDVCDDRWHFVVITHDGTSVRAYVDGACEAMVNAPAALFATPGVFNIGGFGADAATAAGNPHYGRVDEAFITGDVLSEDQIRALYCAKFTHPLGVTPTAARLRVTRRRRGGPLAPADFTTPPIRLHNFTGGSLADEGSGNVALTNPGALSAVAGADGAPGGAFHFPGGSPALAATDAGLPAALAARSYGAWIKYTMPATTAIALAWGSANADAKIYSQQTDGAIRAASGNDVIVGPYMADGQWHFAVVTEDNAAGDGVRRKFYVDGRLVGASTVLTSLTLGGANRFRVGANWDDTLRWVGQVDGAFVCGYALTPADVAKLYAKGSQALAPSPKNEGDHVEAMDAMAVLATFDALDSAHVVDMGVAA